jgi:ABC-type Zn uptake system ZnuABC Zn-binding protein ZnuA
MSRVALCVEQATHWRGSFSTLACNLVMICLLAAQVACEQTAAPNVTTSAPTAATNTSSTTAPTVLVALAPLYSLSKPLLANTGITLQLVPDEARSMQAQTTLFTRQAERYADTLAKADAVITAGKLWTADPLYTAVRSANIRAINIDASKPWSHELDGVAVANSPSSNNVSPYFWLSPSNVLRMLSILSNDLQRLYPTQAATIALNTTNERAKYQQLKDATEQALLSSNDPLLFALSDQFVYLTSDLGIFVDGYFVKQDIDWQPADYAALTEQLKSGDIKVVLHQWQPAPAIVQAIEAAGAKLLVLDNLETAGDFYVGMQGNLAALLKALGAEP